MFTDKSHYSGADVEKVLDIEHDPTHYIPRTTIQELGNLDDGVPRDKGTFGQLWKLAGRFDAFGAEARGIERVLPEQRAVASRLSTYFHRLHRRFGRMDERELTIIATLFTFDLS